MRSRPSEILDQAENALGAVTDLLCSINADDLHCVSPGRLYTLLELVRDKLQCAKLEMAQYPGL